MLKKGVSELVERQKGMFLAGWPDNNGFGRAKGEFFAALEN